MTPEAHKGRESSIYAGSSILDSLRVRFGHAEGKSPGIETTRCPLFFSESSGLPSRPVDYWSTVCEKPISTPLRGGFKTRSEAERRFRNRRAAVQRFLTGAGTERWHREDGKYQQMPGGGEATCHRHNGNSKEARNHDCQTFFVLVAQLLHPRQGDDGLASTQTRGVSRRKPRREALRNTCGCFSYPVALLVAPDILCRISASALSSLSSQSYWSLGRNPSRASMTC